MSQTRQRDPRPATSRVNPSKKTLDFRQIDPFEASLSTERPTGEKTRERMKAGIRAGLNDELLVCFRLMVEGRLSALSDLYDMLGRGLFGYVRALLGTVEDAEDVLQEVFAKLATHRKKLVRVENPKAYVFAMARNEAIKVMRLRSRGISTDPEHPLLQGILAPERVRVGLSPAEAQDALERLPGLQREVVVLKIYEGFTYEEIGRLTGVSPNTAASRYRYAMAKLARSLRKYHGSV